MALVAYGGGITDARGSIGGQVHSRNRSGNYIRARTTPVNPNTVRQNGVRDNLSNAVALWANTLTQAQRDQWGVYAAAIPRQNKLGQTIFLTGFNWFVGNNTMRLTNGLPVVSAGPATLSLPVPDPTFAITVDETNQEISVVFDDTMDYIDEDDAGMQVQMGIPQPVTREFFNGPWRIADTILGDSVTPLTSPQTMDAPYPVQEGQRVYARARITRADGRVSDFFRATTVVIA